MFWKARGFLNVFIKRATASHRRASFLNWICLQEKLYFRWSNQVGKIILTAGQFAWCPACNETSTNGTCYINCWCKLGQTTLSRLVHLTHLALYMPVHITSLYRITSATLYSDTLAAKELFWKVCNNSLTSKLFGKKFPAPFVFSRSEYGVLCKTGKEWFN